MKKASLIIKDMHQTVLGLYKSGAIDKKSMRDFDKYINASSDFRENSTSNTEISQNNYATR